MAALLPPVRIPEPVHLVSHHLPAVGPRVGLVTVVVGDLVHQVQQTAAVVVARRVEVELPAAEVAEAD